MKQQQLFGNQEERSIPVAEVAAHLGVSTATVRNWLKTGYLLPAGKGKVSALSLEEFEQGAAGTEKLISRANKSLSDSHDHTEICSQFIAQAEDPATDLETLGSDYETSLSNSFRNKEGIYYTPSEIIAELLQSLPKPKAKTSFCDPCCGSGNFLIAAIRSGYSPEKLYGFDVDPVAVEITKRRIYQETGYQSRNIQTANFLDFATSRQPPTFDVVATNPPWGKKLPKAEKESLGVLLDAGKSLDTSALFFLACLRSTPAGGNIALLLPDAFSNISIWEDIRSETLKYAIDRLIDFGKPFKGLMTRAHGIVVQKNSPAADHIVECTNEGIPHQRTQKSFASNPRKIFNFHATQEDSSLIDFLYEQPHITLKHQAQWALGIVTGNNKKYCQTNPSSLHLPVYKGSDLGKNEIAPPTHYLLDDFDCFQQVAPLELYNAPSKLVYKFISSNLTVAHDTEQRKFLNSANILIPDPDFPVSHSSLCKLLNSDLLNWVFKKLFQTHKVLRSDLEDLPLHTDFFLQQDHFDEERYLAFLKLQKTSNGTFRIREETD